MQKTLTSFIYYCISVSVLCFSMSAANAASLDNALSAAYKNNPSLKAGRSELKATDETASQAFSGWLPTATFTKERGREEGTFGTRPESSTITDSEVFRLSQPLFKGGETISQMHRAKNLVKSGRYTLQSREQDILLEAVTAYMDVVRDEKVLEISKNNESVLHKHLQATQERFDLGEVTKTDTSQAKARLSRSVSDKIVAEGQLASSKAAYHKVILEKAVDIKAPKVIPEVPDSLEGVLAEAKKNSPDILSRKFGEKVAKNEVGIFTARILPDASLNVSSRKDKGSLNFGGSDIETDAVTVSVTIPLYQSGAEYSRVRQAKHTENTRRFELEDAKNIVEADAIRAWQQLQVSIATIAASQENVKAATVALRGVQQEAEVGSRTTLDVLDAEQELFIAKTDLVRAKRNQVVAVYSILGVMGQLTAQSLGLNVPHYNPEKHYKSVRFKPFGLGID